MSERKEAAKKLMKWLLDENIFITLEDASHGNPGSWPVITDNPDWYPDGDGPFEESGKVIASVSYGGKQYHIMVQPIS